MKLTTKNNQLFAVKEDGCFVGKIVNETTGQCVENPAPEDPGFFARVFSGHGDIYHQSDNPPNPFFVSSWCQIFDNPELLPTGTKNIFIDQSFDAQRDW